MGSGKDGITVVNGSVFGKEFGMLDSLNKANNYFTFSLIHRKVNKIYPLLT